MVNPQHTKILLTLRARILPPAAVLLVLAGAGLAARVAPTQMQTQSRPRAREAGVRVGVLATGPLNAITDVAGVRVGHTTLVRGADVRTGVTAVLPHAGNL